MWVWTFGADRIVTGVSSDKQIAPIKINTIGGPVHAMAISPIDGARFVIYSSFTEDTSCADFLCEYFFCIL